jgi:hypothetical protein
MGDINRLMATSTPKYLPTKTSLESLTQWKPSVELVTHYGNSYMITDGLKSLPLMALVNKQARKQNS